MDTTAEVKVPPSRHYFYRKATQQPDQATSPSNILLNGLESANEFEKLVSDFVDKSSLQSPFERMRRDATHDLIRRKADRKARKEKEEHAHNHQLITQPEKADIPLSSREKATTKPVPVVAAAEITATDAAVASVEGENKKPELFEKLNVLTPNELNGWLSNIHDDAMLMNPHQWLKLASLFNVNSKASRQPSLLDIASLDAVLEDRSIDKSQVRPLENFLELRDIQNRNYARDAVAEGVKFIKQNRIKEAMEFYKRALDMDPKYAEGWFHVAEGLVQQRKLTEAADHLERVLRLDATHEGAKALLASIRHTTQPKKVEKGDEWDIVDEHGESINKKVQEKSTKKHHDDSDDSDDRTANRRKKKRSSHRSRSREDESSRRRRRDRESRRRHRSRDRSIEKRSRRSLSREDRRHRTRDDDRRRSRSPRRTRDDSHDNRRSRDDSHTKRYHETSRRSKECSRSPSHSYRHKRDDRQSKQKSDDKEDIIETSTRKREDRHDSKHEKRVDARRSRSPSKRSRRRRSSSPRHERRRRSSSPRRQRRRRSSSPRRTRRRRSTSPKRKDDRKRRSLSPQKRDDARRRDSNSTHKRDDERSSTSIKDDRSKPTERRSVPNAQKEDSKKPTTPKEDRKESRDSKDNSKYSTNLNSNDKESNTAKEHTKKAAVSGQDSTGTKSPKPENNVTTSLEVKKDSQTACSVDMVASEIEQKKKDTNNTADVPASKNDKN